ncbi:MAG: sugar transferase [Flavobacteriales bacterium]|nr:sugar transferase [Flavobacteriales bacterium]
MMNRRLQTLKYVLADLFASGLAWAAFYSYRKLYIEHTSLEFGEKFHIGIIAIPITWLALYLITGTYKNIYRKSRILELGQTLFISFIGVLIIFFALLLDDEVASYKQYYTSFFVLLSFHFLLTFIPRLILTSIAANKIHNRIIGFPTLLVGSNDKAFDTYAEMQEAARSAGNKFAGFVHINGNNGSALREHMPHLGGTDDILQVIDKHEIEEVILAIETSEHVNIKTILTKLEQRQVRVKITPDMYDILSGSVKMSAIYGTPLIEVSHDIMPVWQQYAKQAIDFVTSLLVLVIGSPMFLFTACCVKFSSKGPVFYTHERIGIHGKPFRIIKFRSMRTDAEDAGPALSSENDPRITSFGRFMRKIRLDEIPQFFNVLKGDMSLVGPRPERQFYIDQIVKISPHYVHLQKVKPGITSWGQVKYGYAENVDEMIQRLKYDIIYIENMSLIVDFKILIYTVLTVIRGNGR